MTRDMYTLESTDEKTVQMTRLLEHVSAIMDELRPDKPLMIVYGREDDETVNNCYSDWQRQRFEIIPGNEYITIWQDEAPCNLLYVVNVTWDSPLAALHELFELLQHKF